MTRDELNKLNSFELLNMQKEITFILMDRALQTEFIERRENNADKRTEVRNGFKGN